MFSTENGAFYHLYRQCEENYILYSEHFCRLLYQNTGMEEYNTCLAGKGQRHNLFCHVEERGSEYDISGAMGYLPVIFRHFRVMFLVRAGIPRFLGGY